MTICVIDKGHCMCQPDEGVFCPNYKPDAYVQCLMDTITELRARAALHENAASQLAEIVVAPEEARDSDAKDAARWRWLLSHNAMPSANGDYGTPSIEFHLPEEQQGQWIARGGEELNRVVDSFLPQSNESKLACVHRGGCRKVNECMAEQRCTALDAANGRTPEGK